MWFINDFALYLDVDLAQAQQVRMPILGTCKTGKIASSVSQATPRMPKLGMRES